MYLKICGITRLTDARHAAEEGATAIGFVFWRQSPRYVTPEQAAGIIAGLPSDVQSVGVFVNQPVDEVRRVARIAGLTAVQLHGDETPEYAGGLELPILRAVGPDGAAAASAAWPAKTLLLIDAVDPVLRGGTGVAIDWTRAADVARVRRIVLAGGLTPENVSEAVATVRPFGVDVSSGVEAAPGVKDFSKVSRFLKSARAAFGEGESDREGSR